MFAALNELGIPTSFDPNDGRTAGASFLPASLDPYSQVRADAHRSYNATIYSRPNLDIWTGQHVTRILFEQGSGNANTTTPVPGDNSVGQGNATNPDGVLFGVGNTTAVVMASGDDETTIQAEIRSFYSQGLRRVKRWVALEVKRLSAIWARQNTEQPPMSTGNTLRAIGVEVSK